MDNLSFDNMKFLKEYRCANCNKLFFKGEIARGTIEIKCKNCKQFSILKGKNCRLRFFLDKKVKSSDLRDLRSVDIKRVMIECEKCSEKSECCSYQKLHRELCPLCSKKLDK